LAVYLTWLFVALPPYLLEALSVERRPFLPAWRPAFLGLARAPLSAHLYVVMPLVLVVISFFTRTFSLLVLISLALSFAATQVRPLVERADPPEESADQPEDPAPA
ncbi:MAG: hypothetical protein ACR2LA_03725, partial [Acidimicrobiales bacterium]